MVPLAMVGADEVVGRRQVLWSLVRNLVRRPRVEVEVGDPIDVRALVADPEHVTTDEVRAAADIVMGELIRLVALVRDEEPADAIGVERVAIVMPGGGKLDRYDSMRDFTSTPEPAGRIGGTPDGRRRYVVQRHRATRLHWDLRLEVDGVLVSWAVPRGPGLDPARKSLAVRTEDHPYDYGWFEGVIPSGYGKGDVVLWDDGWWEPDPEYPDSDDPAAAIAAGELKFVLAGRKLRGRYVIIKTSGRNGRRDGDEWLLIHKRDGAAVAGWDPEDHPRSVLSGRTNDDVAAGRAGRWPAATAEELAALDDLATKGGRWVVDGVETALTNLDKVMMPGRDGGAAVTKRDLVRYYTSVASWLSASLSGRPINLNRFPDGIEGAKGGFYHKAVPAHAPGVRAAMAEPARRGRRDAGLPADRRRAGAGVGGQPRRFRDPPVDVDRGHAAAAELRPGRHRSGHHDVVGGHAGDRPPVPRGDGAPRAGRPPEGHRQAGRADLDPGACGLHLPRDVGVRRAALARPSAAWCRSW